MPADDGLCVPGVPASSVAEVCRDESESGYKTLRDQAVNTMKPSGPIRFEVCGAAGLRWQGSLPSLPSPCLSVCRAPRGNDDA
jgi:hypothetical protein